MVKCARALAAGGLMALCLFVSVQSRGAGHFRRSANDLDRLNPNVNNNHHKGQSAADLGEESGTFTFTSSNRRSLHEQEPIEHPQKVATGGNRGRRAAHGGNFNQHQGHKHAQRAARAAQNEERMSHIAQTAKETGPLTDSYFAAKTISTRGVRSDVVNTLIANLNSEGRPEFGDMVSLEEDTYSLNVHNHLLNHMRVKLPSLMDNYRNPTWVEDHPELNSNISATSFFHQCYPVFRKGTSRRTPSGHRFMKEATAAAATAAPQMQEKNGYELNETLNYNRRAACVPYFMVIGAHGLVAQDIAGHLRLHSRHILSVNFDRHNYWDYRQCTDALECTSDYVPPTFAEYKTMHQEACEQARRQSFFLEDRTEYHPDVVGDVFTGILNWNPCWKQVPGNEGRLAPRVTSAHHVHALMPDLKLIVLMRDPIKKTLGLFRRLFKRPIPWVTADAQAFNDEVSREIAKFEHCKTTLTMTNKQCVYHFIDNGEVDIITQGIYHVFVEDYKNIFPAENVVYMRFEEFKHDDNSTIAQVLDFLGVPQQQKNPNPEDDEDVDLGIDMFNSTRDMLREFFRPHNEQLQIQIGTDFAW